MQEDVIFVLEDFQKAIQYENKMTLLPAALFSVRNHNYDSLPKLRIIPNLKHNPKFELV